MGRLAKTRFVGAAVAVAVVAVCVALLSGMPHAQQDENVMRDFQGNPVPAEQAERIRMADAHWPLASRVKAYDAGGERIALSDVDPATYDGFVAVLDNDDPDTARRLEEARAAGAVTSTDGFIATFDSMDSFARYFDESHLESIEPDYKVYLASDVSLYGDDDPIPEAGDDAAAAGAGKPVDSAAAGQAAAFPPKDAGATDLSALAPDDVQAALVSTQLAAEGATISPNDPLSFDQTDLELTHVDEAWEAGATGAGVVVAVVDSGLVGTDPDNTFSYKLPDYQHEDIDYDDHILEGWDFSKVMNGRKGPTPDGIGHGTFVTGQIVATKGNGKGVTGIAPDAKVQPFKTYNEKGEGHASHLYYALSTILENLSDPNEPHVDVINMSLIYKNPVDYMVDRAYQPLVNRGVIIVAATGNQASGDPTYPASHDCVIGVSATKKSGAFDAGYSNYGAGSVYVAAPGTSIMGVDRIVAGSIIIGDSNRGPDVYSNQSGTSMACPEVAALAALAKSIDKNIDQYEFMSRLRATSVDMGDVGYDQYYGWGLIDSGALIASMQVPDDVYASGTYGGIDWYITAADAPSPYQLVLSRSTAGADAVQTPWSEHATVVKSVYTNPRLEGGAWLAGAFSGMTSVEALWLGNMSVPANVACQDVFAGLDRLTTIEIGSGWQASALFPDPPGVNCVTGWSAASTKQEHAMGASVPVGVSETYNAIYSHSYQTVGDGKPPTLHEPGVATKRCTVCGHETYVYSYVDPAAAGAAHWGVLGGVGWYITPDSYAAAPARLVIYPLDGVAGTIKRGVVPVASDWPWDDHRASIRSVSVAAGVNAGDSMAYMFRDLVNCTSMDVGKMDVSGVTYMDRAFFGCTALTRLDLGEWNPSSCENIPYMFMNCANLETLVMPSSSFAALRTAKGAFDGCAKVTEIDLSGIKFYENTDATRFFGGCGFDKITLKGGWNRSDVPIPIRYSGKYEDEYGHIFSWKWVNEDGAVYGPGELNGVSGTLVLYVDHKWGPPQVVSNGTCGTVRQYTCKLCGAVKTESDGSASTHEIAHMPGQAALCEQAGYREYWYCAKCETKFADAAGSRVIEAIEAIPALGHDRRTTAAVEATCTEAGKTGGDYCARCEKVFSHPTEVPALGHDYEVRENSATCIEAGVTTSVCKRCGHTLVQENAAALGHDYVTTETPPTCTEAATIVHACTRCGDTRTEEGTAALGHDHAMTETPPTCTEAGRRTYSCTRCDDSYTQEGAPALGHDYAATEVGPTCTEAGQVTHACTRCRDTYSEAGAPALGHDFSREVSPAVAPTCTAEGKSAVMGCSRCEERRGGEALPKADHAPGAPERENEVAATCERGGSYDEVTRCSACRAQLSSDHRATDPLGHDYAVTEKAPTCTEDGQVSYACKRCSHAYDEGKPALGHDDVIAHTPATCTEAGSSTHTCERCGRSFVEVGEPALGHNYALEHVPPTCTEPGRITYTCKRCPDTYTEVGTASLGHDYVATETPATCTEAAQIVRACTRCDDTHTEEGAPALGHDYVVTEVEPTCTEAGTSVHACTRCDDTRTEEGASALGHDFSREASPAVAPTCDQEGRSAVMGCTRCDARQGGEAVPKVDHVWTGPLWQWAPDMGSAQATFVCEKYAHHKRVLNAEVSVRDAGAQLVYTAVVNDGVREHVETVAVPKKPGDDSNNADGDNNGGSDNDNTTGDGDHNNGGNNGGNGNQNNTGGNSANGNYKPGGSVNAGNNSGNANNGSAGNRGSYVDRVNAAIRNSFSDNSSSRLKATGKSSAASAKKTAPVDESTLVDGELRSNGFRITLDDTPGSLKTVEVVPLREGPAYDALIKKATETPGGTLIGAYDVILKINGEEVHEGFGSLRISFPVPSQYDRRVATLYHAHAGNPDDISSYGPAAVNDDSVTFHGIEDLSPFALKINKQGSTGDLAGVGQKAAERFDANALASGVGAERPSSDTLAPGGPIAWAIAVVAALALLGALAFVWLRRMR